MTNANIIKGKMKQVEGKLEAGLGHVVDSPKHEVKGRVKEAEGEIQESYGKGEMAAKKAMHNARAEDKSRR